MRLRQISTMRILFFLDRLNLPISINSSQGPGNLHLEAPSVSLHGHPTDFRRIFANSSNNGTSEQPLGILSHQICGSLGHFLEMTLVGHSSDSFARLAAALN
ncbi:uncharacterized protein LOC112182000 [Rosa chinensis]|uniref:uncharacterized protein LOC112182000 n=1 Tax=Rosa chinensis TaxID=74649 RepID=UPI001AD8FD65|nr:uncharacterized protein LOC112182000 [Rosa chinensis]